MPVVLISTERRRIWRPERPLGASIMPILEAHRRDRHRPWLKRTPLDNIRETGSEFVVNVLTVEMARRSRSARRASRLECDRVRRGGPHPGLGEGQTFGDRGMRRLDGVRAEEEIPSGEVLLIIGRVVHLEGTTTSASGSGMDFERARPMSADRGGVRSLFPILTMAL